MLPLQLYTSAGRFNEFLLEKLLFRLALVGNSCGYVELDTTQWNQPLGNRS